MRAAARVVVACFALVLSSCGDGPTAPNPADYQGFEWRLASLQRPDFSIVAPPAGATFTARFDDDAQLVARADCNACHAEYAAAGNGLSVAPMACTRAFCASAPFDGEYVQALAMATSFEAGDEGLTLRSPHGTLRFVR